MLGEKIIDFSKIKIKENDRNEILDEIKKEKLRIWNSQRYYDRKENDYENLKKERSISNSRLNHNKRIIWKMYKAGELVPRDSESFKKVITNVYKTSKGYTRIYNKKMKLKEKENAQPLIETTVEELDKLKKFIKKIPEKENIRTLPRIYYFGFSGKIK